MSERGRGNGRGGGRGGNSGRGGRSGAQSSEFDHEKGKLDSNIKELSERMKALQLEEKAINPREKEAERKELQKKLNEIRDKKNEAMVEHGSTSKEVKEIRSEEAELRQQLDAIRADQDRKYDTIRNKKTERDNIQRKIDELYKKKRELILSNQKKLEEQVHHLNGKGGEQASAGKAATHLGDEPKRQEKEAEEEVNDPNAAKKFVCRGLIRYMEELVPAAGITESDHAPADQSAHAETKEENHGKSDEALGGVMLNKKMHGGADLFTFGDNGKKKDKGKKPAKAAGKSPAAVKFPLQIIDDFAFIGVNPPLTKSDLGSKLEELRQLAQRLDAGRSIGASEISEKPPTSTEEAEPS